MLHCDKKIQYIAHIFEKLIKIKKKTLAASTILLNDPIIKFLISFSLYHLINKYFNTKIIQDNCPKQQIKIRIIFNYQQLDRY